MSSKDAGAKVSASVALCVGLGAILLGWVVGGTLWRRRCRDGEGVGLLLCWVCWVTI